MRVFAAGQLTGALNVPADGRFAESAGMVLQPADHVVVMSPDGGAQEVAVRPARIGFDHVIGYLPDGETMLAAHPEPTSRASRLTPRQLAEASRSPHPPVVIDVRNGAESDAGAPLDPCTSRWPNSTNASTKSAPTGRS